MTRRKILTHLIIGITVILGFYDFTSAVDYPLRDIDLVVPFAPGGSTSMAARIASQPASEIIRRPIIIVNKAGAGGTIGAAYVARAKPDGYTLFAASSASNGAAIAFRSNPGYTNSDFQFISQYSIEVNAVACKIDAPWNTMKDLVEYAKKNPGVLKCATTGVGASADALLELIKSEGGDLKIAAVPFSGSGPSTLALLGGHTHFANSFASNLKGLYEAKKLKLLAVASSERSKDFPDVPTLKEQGLDIVLDSWYGIAVPAQVPKEIVLKLREVFAKASQNHETMEMLKTIGHTPYYRDSEAFTKFVKDMELVYSNIAKRTGVKID